jgi:hypothetical protein
MSYTRTTRRTKTPNSMHLFEMFSLALLTFFGAQMLIVSPCLAQPFEVVVAAPSCNSFEALSFTHTIGSQPGGGTVTFTKHIDNCSPPLLALVVNASHLEKVVVPISSANEQIILDESLITSISTDAKDIETLVFAYGTLKIEFGVKPTMQYNFYRAGTNIVAASFMFGGIMRDASPASIPIKGFTGFVAPSPASLAQCDLTSNSSAALNCLAVSSSGGIFQFIFNYGGFPTQPGPFTGSGFLAPDRTLPGLDTVQLLDGQILTIP